MLVVSIAAGALWAGIPAFFKAKWGTNETLFTLMMNYIATYLVSYFLIIWVPSGSSTLNKMKFGNMPKLLGNDYGIVVVVAMVLTAVMFIYLNYTKPGYEINVVGESVRTAQYIGIPVKKDSVSWICGKTRLQKKPSKAMISGSKSRSPPPNGVPGSALASLFWGISSKIDV